MQFQTIMLSNALLCKNKDHHLPTQVVEHYALFYLTFGKTQNHFFKDLRTSKVNNKIKVLIISHQKVYY